MWFVAAVSAVPSSDRVLLAWAAALRAACAGRRTLCVDADPAGGLSRVCSPTLSPANAARSAGTWLAGSDPLAAHSVSVRIRFVDRPFWAQEGRVSLLPAGARGAPPLGRTDGMRLRRRLGEGADPPEVVVLDVPPYPAPAAEAAANAADVLLAPLVVGAHADDELAQLHHRLAGAAGGRGLPPMLVVLVGARRRPALAEMARGRIRSWIDHHGVAVTLAPGEVAQENRSVNLAAAGFQQADHARAVEAVPLGPPVNR